MKCQLEGISIHYESVGHGRPFVAIPGSPGDHRIISSWMEPIFEARPGWRRFYFDLPGTGQTPGADWISNKAQVLDVVCDFLDAVLPDQPFTLLGVSAGGHFARGVVYRRAALVEGLCLLVPWLSPYDDPPLPEPVTFVQDPAVIAQLPPDEVEFFENLFVVQDQRILEWYRDVVVPARAGADRQFLNRVLPNWEFPFDPDDLVFDKPALILVGRQDTHTGYREAWDVLETYPRATLAVLDRAGHGLGLEQEALFQALINEWLDRVEAYAGEGHA